MMDTQALRLWLEDMPPDTLLSASGLLGRLEGGSAHTLSPPQPILQNAASRLWTCNPETRITVSELAEALNRPKSHVHALTRKKSKKQPIPHVKYSGQIHFIAWEIREWLQETEERIVKQYAPITSQPRKMA